MHSKSVYVLVFLLFSFSLQCSGFEKVDSKVTDGYPVHNLSTGLNYTTIQEAISASNTSDGNTIQVDAGIYFEHVEVTKSISLIGEDRDSTIIDGNGTGTVVAISVDSVTVSGLTIRNAGRTWVETPGYIESCIQGSNVANVTIENVSCIGGAVSVWFDNSLYVNISGNAVTDGESLGIGGYTLQNVIISNNAVFNCTRADGIHLDGGSRYCTVSNNTVTDCFDGITLETNAYSPWPTSDNLIDGNSIENMTLASIGLFNCGTNVFRSNNMTGKQNSLVVWGSGPEAFVQDIDTSNTANGRIPYFLSNRSDLIIDPVNCPNADDVVIADCTNMTIRDFDLSYRMDGILLAGSEGCSLTNITIGNNVEPIVYQGVPLIYGGITLFESDNNTIAGTEICNNTYGVCQYHSDWNVFYHNSFVNVEKPVISDYTSVFRNASSGYISHGVWDNGVEGNFWSDYRGSDEDHDGIGDVQYVIDANNTDDYPLMGMCYEFLPSFFSNRSVSVIAISNSTVSDLIYAVWLSTPSDGLQPGEPFISLSVTGQNGTFGFCRLVFPRSVLNSSTYAVMIDSRPVNATELPTSNSTDVCLYFTYPHSTHEVIVTIPEFSWLVSPLFMMATLLSLIVYRRRR